MGACLICGGSTETLFEQTDAGLRAEMQRKIGVSPPAEVPVGDYKVLRCDVCTFEFAEPQRPGSEAFYQWLSKMDWYYPGGRWEWQVAIDEMAAAKAKTVIEVGCGSGNFLELLKRKSDIRGIGLELVQSVVDTCRARGFEVHKCDLGDYGRELGPAIGKADAILAFHCLEHVPDPVHFLRQMREVVGQGGTMYASTPYSPMSYEHLWPDPLNIPPHHLSRWNAAAYRKTGEMLGMKVRFFMPRASGTVGRAANALAKVKNYAERGGKMARLMGMAAHPVAAMKEIAYQGRRDRVDGAAASDVVLVEFRAA